MATKKQAALKVVNPLLGLFMVNQVVTGTFHLYLSARAYRILHEWSGLVLLALSIMHVVLNWGWIKAHFLHKR